MINNINLENNRLEKIPIIFLIIRPSIKYLQIFIDFHWIYFSQQTLQQVVTIIRNFKTFYSMMLIHIN